MCKNSDDRLGGPPFVIVEDPTQPFMANNRRIHVDYARQLLQQPDTGDTIVIATTDA